MSKNQNNPTNKEYSAIIDRSDLLPKFFTYLQRGMDFHTFKADFLAGLTVAIVALPLSMAIAIASNAPPDVGLKTAFVAGFWISVLGGSRFQIGGPTAAFSIVVAGIIGKFGMDGLIIATLMAGLILIAAAVFKLGVLLKYVPHTVVVGFTAGIALTIFISQIAPFFGIVLHSNPETVFERILEIIHNWQSLNPWAIAVSLLSLLVIVFFRRIAPSAPYFLIVVIISSLAVFFLKIDAQTVGQKFGEIHTTIPKITIPSLKYADIIALMPSALTIAFLAGIESLLSAVVADGMTGGKHRPNAELLGQGVANIASAISGGLPATGAIARTATNIRAGAKTPMAGALHATLLLLILLAAGKLTSYIPIATLSAILMIVAWNMAEADRFIRLFRFSENPDRLVLVSTFLLTVFADLTIAVEAGIILSAIIFMMAMSENTKIHDDPKDAMGNLREKFPSNVEVFKLSGPLFFGAVGAFVEALENMKAKPIALVLNLKEVTYIDSSGLAALLDVVENLKKAKIELIIVGASIPIRKRLAKIRKILGNLQGVRLIDNDEGALEVINKLKG